MERYTKRLPNGQASWNYQDMCYGENETSNKVFKSVHRQKACEKLAAYEDTGLDPEDIADLMGAHAIAISQLAEYHALGPIDRFGGLAQAEGKEATHDPGNAGRRGVGAGTI